MRDGTAHRCLSYLLVLPFLLLAGCGETQERAEADVEPVTEEAVVADAVDQEVDPLEGEYTMPSGARVVVEDGSYTVYDGDEVAVVGNYMYEGDQVIFVDSEGPMACPSEMRGVYTLARDEANEPYLSLVDDPCDGRRRDITGEAETADDAELEEAEQEEHGEH